MRLSMTRETDGRAAAGECCLCGAVIWRDEEYYHVDGEAFCEDCLEAYARMAFATFRCVGGEDTWR